MLFWSIAVDNICYFLMLQMLISVCFDPLLEVSIWLQGCIISLMHKVCSICFNSQRAMESVQLRTSIEGKLHVTKFKRWSEMDGNSACYTMYSPLYNELSSNPMMFQCIFLHTALYYRMHGLMLF